MNKYHYSIIMILLFVYFDFPRPRSRIPIDLIQYRVIQKEVYTFKNLFYKYY
jgi:hypothetical protein